MIEFNMLRSHDFLRNVLVFAAMVAVCGAAREFAIWVLAFFEISGPQRLFVPLAMATLYGVLGYFVFAGDARIRTMLVFFSVIVFGGVAVIVYDPGKTFYPLLNSLPLAAIAAVITSAIGRYVAHRRIRHVPIQDSNVDAGKADERAMTSAEVAPKKRKLVGAAIGVIVAIFILVVLMIPSYQGSSQSLATKEAVNLLASAKNPSAEYFADKGKWPEKAEQVMGHTSGKYTERISITAGAGAASGTFTLTATIKSSGFFISSRLAGKTVQASTQDDGKTWTCGPGTPNGVDEKFLPAACRQ